MIPITRKEKYINEIVGGGDTAPGTPQTREELFFADILGEVSAPFPITNIEKYLAKIAGKYNGELPEPITRIEFFIARAAGMNVSAPTPITREEMFWADYAAVAEYAMHDIPPLTFNAVAGSLKNYRIYGQTVDGESVGDRTGNLFNEESTKIPGFIDDSGRINTSTVIPGGVSTYDYIECSASTSYYLRAFTKTDPSSSSITQRVAFFDGNKDFISRQLGASSFSFTTPENCSFIRLSLDDNYQNTVLMQGSTQPTEFIPYGYKVPVTVEGKNLFDNSKTANILKCCLSVSILVSSMNTRTIFIECKPSTTYTVSKIRGNRFVVGWSDKLPAPGVELQEKVINYNASSITITTGLDAKYLVAYIYNAGQDAPITADEMIASVQIEKGSTATPYETYRTPVTTPIYLDAPLAKSGNNADYIDYAEQKRHNSDGTESSVTLPALPTVTGTNVLSVGTEVQPSEVYIKYEGER